MNLVRTGYRLFCKFEELMVGGMIIAVTFLVFASAVARFAGTPWNWATDLSLLLFAWLTFLGADVALRKADFMRVDLVISRFPRVVQKVLYYVFSLMAIIFLVLIISEGVPLAFENAKRLFQTLGISYAWATVSAPVGALLMIITTSLKLVRNWRVEEIVVEGREAI